MFKELKSLQILVLEFNSIGSIAPDAFTGMTSLRDLYFHRNQVMVYFWSFIVNFIQI
jgi:hypothetical protein